MEFLEYPSKMALFFSEKLNVPDDQIRLVLSLIFSIPLGYIFRFLHSPFLRNIVGVVLGLWMQTFVYYDGVIYCLLQAIISYLLVLIFKRRSAVIVFVESIAYLSLHHVYRQVFDYGSWKMDISVMIMILTCKFTSFAFDFCDGGKEDKFLSLDQQERKIVQLPSFFEYLCYIFFFGGCVAGPTFGFAEFNDFIHERKQYQRIPWGILETLKNLASSSCFIASVVFLMPIFPAQYLNSPKFFTHCYFYQFSYIIISLTIIRCRYYGAWALSQSAMSACGLSFAGFSKGNSESWDKVQTANPMLELYSSPKDKQDKWNTSVQLWLKRYVYYRVYSEEEQRKSHKKMLIAQNATYLTSAVWHGFYPGYYIFFIHMGFVTQLSKNFYKLSMKYDHLPIYDNIVYKTIKFIVPLFAMSYVGVAFPFLEFWKTIEFFRNYYFIPNMLLYGLFLFFNITGVDRVKSGKDSEKKNK